MSTKGKVIKDNWPQSLIDFLTEAQKLAMPRKEITTFPPKPFQHYAPSPLNPTGFSLPALSRNMTNKKIHEVTSLSALVADVAQKLGSNSKL